MFASRNRIILPAVFFIFCYNSSIAQIPDWTLIIDKDDNRYFLDKYGKIRTSGEPEFSYKAVSVDGLEYYLNQGIELLESHNKIQGLTLLKSILALPVKNNNIYDAQVRASKEINRLLTTEGERFLKLNENASLLLFKDDNSVYLVNDNMHFSLKCPLSIKIVSKRERTKNKYKYSGLLLGICFEQESFKGKDKKGNPGYDLLLAIDSEYFPYKIKNASYIEDHWKKRLGADTLERVILQKNDNKIIISYNDTIQPHYSGFEAFYSKGNSGYYLKAITSKYLFQRYKSQIVEIINSFAL